MRSILYLIAVVLVIVWVFGFFFGGPQPSNLLHILLVLAVVSLLLGFIRRGTVD